jgi:hypothetical protein
MRSFLFPSHSGLTLQGDQPKFAGSRRPKFSSHLYIRHILKIWVRILLNFIAISVKIKKNLEPFTFFSFAKHIFVSCNIIHNDIRNMKPLLLICTQTPKYFPKLRPFCYKSFWWANIFDFASCGRGLQLTATKLNDSNANTNTILLCIFSKIEK